jgi:hypothetical protein
MSDKNTINDVANIVDSEGLGYAIQSYLSAENIEDEELRTMWEDAATLLNNIEAYLEDNRTDEDED